jgi:pilus assembly protein Flp/PilA
MRSKCSKLIFRSLRLLADEDGQDLVEYALLIAFLCIAAVAGTHKLATAITSTFTTISTDIANAA